MNIWFRLKESVFQLEISTNTCNIKININYKFAHNCCDCNLEFKNINIISILFERFEILRNILRNI